VFNELEFTEFHVDIPSFEVTKIFDIYIRVPALGLRWEELKSRSPQPQNEIKHDKFATALQLKREFDDDELDVYQLKVSELTDDSYIMVGDKKFIPSCKYWTPAKGGTQQYFRCPNKTTPCPQCAPGRDSFSTIVAVINSGIKKLTRNDVTPLAQSREISYALPCPKTVTLRARLRIHIYNSVTSLRPSLSRPKRHGTAESTS
jgi:hypothetical protein